MGEYTHFPQTALLRVSPAEGVLKLRDLRARHQGRQLGVLVGADAATIAAWLDGRTYIHPLRHWRIWVIWALTFAPHQVGTLFDLATWGRFATPPPGWKPPKPGRQKKRKRRSSRPVGKETGTLQVGYDYQI